MTTILEQPTPPPERRPVTPEKRAPLDCPVLLPRHYAEAPQLYEGSGTGCLSSEAPERSPGEAEFERQATDAALRAARERGEELYSFEWPAEPQPLTAADIAFALRQGGEATYPFNASNPNVTVEMILAYRRLVGLE